MGQDELGWRVVGGASVCVWVGGWGGDGGGVEYFLKTFLFTMHFNSKKWTVLLKFSVISFHLEKLFSSAVPQMILVIFL